MKHSLSIVTVMLLVTGALHTGQLQASNQWPYEPGPLPCAQFYPRDRPMCEWDNKAKAYCQKQPFIGQRVDTIVTCMRASGTATAIGARPPETYQPPQPQYGCSKLPAETKTRANCEFDFQASQSCQGAASEAEFKSCVASARAKLVAAAPLFESPKPPNCPPGEKKHGSNQPLSPPPSPCEMDAKAFPKCQDMNSLRAFDTCMNAERTKIYAAHTAKQTVTTGMSTNPACVGLTQAKCDKWLAAKAKCGALGPETFGTCMDAEMAKP